jgi:hypothetical protein
MPIRIAKDKDGNTYKYRSARDAQGNVKWVRLGLVQETTDALNSFKEKTKEMYLATTPEGRAEARGPEAVKRLQDVKDNTFVENLGQGLINQGVRFAEGAGDLVDTLIGMSNADVLVSQGREMIKPEYRKYYPFKSSIESQLERKKRMDEFNEQQQEFEDHPSVGKYIGSALPYLAFEAKAAPVAKSAVEKILKSVSRTADTVATAGGRAAAKGVETAYKSKIPVVKDIAKSAEENIVKPVSQYARRLKSRPDWSDRDFQGATGDLLGGTLLGAAEGALDYNRSATEGAISGLAGGVAGRVLVPFLSKKHNYNSPAAKETIEWAKDQGIRVPPGIHHNLEHLKDVEAGLRKDAISQNYMSIFENANQQAKNRVAYRAMGIPEDKAAQMTPKEFNTYLRQIKGEYEDLVDSTVGRMDKSKFEAMMNKVQKAKTIYPADKETNLRLERYLKDIADSTRVSRDVATGKFKKATFKGADYQRIRRAIKNDLNKAYKDGDVNAADSYRELLESLDEAIKDGVEEANPNLVSQWKDLNERYAMAETLMDHGLDLHGNIDANKFLQSAAVRKDMRRILTGQGGRIKDLHKLAKYQELENKAKSKVMMGTSQEREGNLPLAARLIYNRIGNAAPRLQKGYMKTYMEGYPVLTGLLGMERFNGFWKPSTFTRTAAQTSNIHNTILDYLGQAKEFAFDDEDQ